MASHSQKDVDPEILEAVDKILNKSFDDIRKRVLAVMVRREKKIAREVAAATKASTRVPDSRTPRKSTRESRAPCDTEAPSRSKRDKAPARESSHRNKRSSYHRSQSSSSESD